MWTLIWTAVRGSLGPFLVLFIAFLRERRADDPRLLAFALKTMQDLEKLNLSGSEKKKAILSSLLRYAGELGLDIGAAGADSVIQLVLPRARKEEKL